ncbi:MAG: hypothetical protein IIZ38_12855 [Sphingomonas sp.]|uniref:hypothetical protein n=1 Tax=Sphingomonas sp. TaxID=28214 RepID=UPI0025D17C81|nr:hypothetical protein [Sphingomonas sp.]MBQ1499196.1 hypothetical protein [Sphingomonas sp.]
MRGFGIKARIGLIGVIVLILLGYGWWFLAPRGAAVPDAEIEITGASVDLAPGPGALAKLPLFDPATGKWIVDGKAHASAIGLVPPPAGPRGPDDIGRYLTARLPEGAGKREMQAAMRALAPEGICQVALLVPGMESAPVIRIRRVADGRGGMIACRDRLNPSR